MDFPLTVSFLKKLVYWLCLIAILFSIPSWLHPEERNAVIGPVLLLSFIPASPGTTKPFCLTLIAGFCAALGFYLAANTHFPLLLASYFFILTVFGTYLLQVYPSYFLPIFLAITLIILSAEQSSLLSEINNRFIIFSISVFMTALLQIIFFSFSDKNDLKINKSAVLRELKKLNAVIFSCLLSQEYIDNVYLYEKRLHEQKNRYIKSIQKLKSILQRGKMAESATQDDKTFIVTTDLLFNNMMDYAQLRRRVTDYTTLSVCNQELTDIFSAVQILMDDVIHGKEKEKIAGDIHTLTLKINNLEDNYYHVLQVASREPLVFLLFINSLKTLSDNIAKLTCPRSIS